ncbi:hypothetical protein LT493_29700 [Streptomyces tricolor]|nr:hypothetical protein [Streptomyces tricolor]
MSYRGGGRLGAAAPGPLQRPGTTWCSAPPSPAARPKLPGVEGMIGMFINTVPTRVGVPDGPVLPCCAASRTGRRRPPLRLPGPCPASRPSATSRPANRCSTAWWCSRTTPWTSRPPPARACGSRRSRADDATTFPWALRAHLAGRLGFDLAYDPALFDPGTAERRGPAGRAARRPRRRVRHRPGRPGPATPADRDLLAAWNTTARPAPRRAPCRPVRRAGPAAPGRARGPGRRRARLTYRHLAE